METNSEADERLEKLLEAKAEGDTGALIEALRDPDNRWHAAEWLGKLGVKEAIPGLLRLLDARDPSIRQGAVISLRRLRAGEAVPRFFEIAKADEAGHIRGSAILSLGEFAAEGMLGEYDLVPFLIESLTDPSWQARGCAALGLALLADPRGRAALVEARKRERGIKNRYLTRHAYKKALRAVRTAT